MPGKTTSETVDIIKAERGSLSVIVRGTSPLIMNRLSEKAQRELLMPRGRKTAADKAASLKHDPIEEFRAAPYRLRAGDAPTLLGVPAGAFKQAMATAALDLPGAKKAQIGRLVYVQAAAEHHNLIPIYGEPQLYMAIVRQADMKRTPDVRTRVIIPAWAAKLTIDYVMPTLRDQPVLNLLAAAGITAGIGDNRPEKGHDSFGQFELVGGDNEAAAAIIKAWGRAPQQAAMDTPTPYDLETEELLAWFESEAPKRGFKVVGAA